MYWTWSVCLNQMTIRVQDSPLVHSGPSILNCSAYSQAKSFPADVAQHWINVMSTADKPLLNRPVPASREPTPRGSDRSTNGALRWGPRGLPNRTQRICSLLSIFLLSPHSSIVSPSTSSSLVRSADWCSCVYLCMSTTSLLKQRPCILARGCKGQFDCSKQKKSWGYGVCVVCVCVWWGVQLPTECSLIAGLLTSHSSVL